MNNTLGVHGFENQINTAFPGGFAFYDQGKVVLDKTSTPEGIEELPNDGIGVAFSVYPMNESKSDSTHLQTLLLTVFEQGLDASVYAEIGNIIASRFAGSLSKLISEEVMITPPLSLKPPAVQRLIRMKRQTLSRRRYFHNHNNKLIPIDVLVLRVNRGAKGNA